MRSIMHQKDGTCYLCILLHEDYSAKITQEHHVIFGSGGRALSEKYGLKVYLCMKHHQHDGGPEAVHRNPDIRKMLCKAAQKQFEKTYPEKSFREIFGKNWLENTDRQQDKRKEDKEPGFWFLE